MSSVVVRDVSLNFGQVEVLKSLNIEVDKGEFLVLLGPSGCGKSTLLNCIAGLLDVSDGQIFINGKNVTWEQPKDRGIGMVFQSYALYPQMSVEGNLSFGLKNARLPKDEIDKRVKRASEILQIEALLKRKPMALSGGQRQRVAIGRALVRDVEVFLFDEPLSNLDAKLRNELRIEIKRLHQRLGNTMVYVTHDQIEAMTLADRIAVMRGGIIQQLDAPQAIYNKPVNRFVAGFIGSPGMNFLDGLVDGGDGKPRFRTGDAVIDIARYGFEAAVPYGAKAVFGVRPEHVVVGEDAAKAPVSMDADIEIVEPMGSDTLAWTKVGGQNFSIRIESEKAPAVGDRIRLGFDPLRASLFDAGSDARL
jgi:multiple sugar transport system ATP-binding protein